jgi:hypothetical protein
VPFPLETKPVTNLAARASLKTTRAHSLVISGSLYVLTMTLPSLAQGVKNKFCGRDAHRADNGGGVA